jgi:hypothetical protein
MSAQRVMNRNAHRSVHRDAIFAVRHRRLSHG